jgi:hypothetical protein
MAHLHYSREKSVGVTNINIRVGRLGDRLRVPGAAACHDAVPTWMLRT